jgi:hypothetical protein
VKVIMGVLGVGAAAAGVVAFGPTVATSAANLFYRVMPFGAAMGLAHKACGPNASCGTLVNHLAQRLGGNAMTVQNLPGRTGNLPGYKYFEHVVLRLQSGMVLDPLEGRIFSSMQAFVSGTFTGPVNVFSPGFAALHTIVP